MVMLANSKGRRASGVPAERDFIQNRVKGVWTETDVGRSGEAPENQAGHVIQLSIAILNLVDGEIGTVS